MKRILLSFGLCLLFTGIGFGQLTEGDIAITSFNADGTDNFSFVLLDAISGTTTIYFTERGWDNDQDGGGATPTWISNSDGTITWTYTGSLPAGTEIQIFDPTNASSSDSASIGTITETGSFIIAASSDVLIAYTGTGTPNDGTEVTNFLWAVKWGSEDFTDNATGTAGSSLPTDLSLGTNAIDLSTLDNYQYDCSTTTPVATLRSAIANTANYNSGSTDTFLAPNCGYLGLNPHVIITGTAGWRLLSLPKSSGTIEDVSDDSPVQGVSGGDDTGSNANVYTYDNSGSFEIPTSVSTAFGDGYGIAMYFFNNTTNGSAELPITMDASGSEPGSDVVVDLYSGATGRFTLVGNPFASRVDLANVSANIAISSNMSFWDNALGSYVTENISGGLVIEPWQGYWVQTGAATAGGQLTFGTADKTSSAADATHFDKANFDSLRELKFAIVSNYNTEKNLTLQFANDASEGWDTYDLLKLGSFLPKNVSGAFVGELDGESILKAIESLPIALDTEITIPLMVSLTGETQEIVMSWEGIVKLPSSWEIFMEDYSNGTKIDLRTSTVYTFTQEGISTSVNPKSILKPSMGETMKLKSDTEYRFGITINPNTIVSNEVEDKPIEFRLDQNYPNPFNPTTNIKYSVGEAGPVNITVYNVMGQKVAEVLNTTKSAGSYQVSWNATGQASGIYYYRLTAPGVVLTRQMTLIK
jgi:hypothetical protein